MKAFKELISHIYHLVPSLSFKTSAGAQQAPVDNFPQTDHPNNYPTIRCDPYKLLAGA